jgi:hypothetical protein
MMPKKGQGKPVMDGWMIKRDQSYYNQKMRKNDTSKLQGEVIMQ